MHVWNIAQCYLFMLYCDVVEEQVKYDQYQDNNHQVICKCVVCCVSHKKRKQRDESYKCHWALDQKNSDCLALGVPFPPRSYPRVKFENAVFVVLIPWSIRLINCEKFASIFVVVCTGYINCGRNIFVICKSIIILAVYV